MIIRKLKNGSELKQCFNLSMEFFEQYKMEGFPVDQRFAYSNLSQMSQFKYFRLLEEEGKIVGWYAAEVVVPLLYNNTRMLQLLIYHTTLKGRKGINALLDVHYDLLEFAKEKRIPYVLTNSVLPNKATFGRVLKSDGWCEFGSSWVKETGVRPRQAASGRRNRSLDTEGMGQLNASQTASPVDSGMVEL